MSNVIVTVPGRPRIITARSPRASFVKGRGISIWSTGTLDVDSIEELRALNPGASETVFVAGYYGQGTNGGGIFYWDAISTDADDGGATIIPDGSIGAGRWKRQFNGFISLAMFGSVPNDSNYQTDMIKAAWIAGNHAPIFLDGNITSIYWFKVEVSAADPIKVIKVYGSAAYRLDEERFIKEGVLIDDGGEEEDEPEPNEQIIITAPVTDNLFYCSPTPQYLYTPPNAESGDRQMNYISVNSSVPNFDSRYSTGTSINGTGAGQDIEVSRGSSFDGVWSGRRIKRPIFCDFHGNRSGAVSRLGNRVRLSGTNAGSQAFTYLPDEDHHDYANIEEWAGRGFESIWVKDDTIAGSGVTAWREEEAPNWLTATDYEEGDLRQIASNLYRCEDDHTSGVFADDFADGLWQDLGPTTKTVFDGTGYETFNILSLGRFGGARLPGKAGSHANGINVDGRDGLIHIGKGKDIDVSGYKVCAGIYEGLDISGKGKGAFNHTLIAEKVAFNGGYIGQNCVIIQTCALNGFGILRNSSTARRMSVTGDRALENLGTGPGPDYPADAWVTGTFYFADPPPDFVTNGGFNYRALVNHTAGASFATDLADGKWVKIAYPVAQWVAPHSYFTGDIITQGGKLYRAQVDHTSTVFLTDKAAGKWFRMAGNGQYERRRFHTKEEFGLAEYSDVGGGYAGRHAGSCLYSVVRGDSAMETARVIFHDNAIGFACLQNAKSRDGYRQVWGESAFINTTLGKFGAIKHPLSARAILSWSGEVGGLVVNHNPAANMNSALTPDQITAAIKVYSRDGDSVVFWASKDVAGFSQIWSGTGTKTSMATDVTSDPGPSNAASLLHDWKYLGVSKASVRRDGRLTAASALFTALPTSAAGLPAGAIWNNGGVINVA